MIAGDGSIHTEAAGRAPVAEGVGGCGVCEDGSSRSCRWSLGGDDGVGVWQTPHGPPKPSPFPSGWLPADLHSLPPSSRLLHVLATCRTRLHVHP